MLAPLVFVDQKQLSEPGAGGPERAKGFARPDDIHARNAKTAREMLNLPASGPGSRPGPLHARATRLTNLHRLRIPAGFWR
jgi:hypothetical protein